MRKQTVFTQSTFTDVETTPQQLGQLGQIVFDQATKAHHQFVHMSATASDAATPTPAASLLAYWKDSDSFEICTHIGVAEGNANSVAGILNAALLAGKYGWVQKSGRRVVACAADSASAVGALLEYDGDDDGKCQAVAPGTAANYIPVGVIESVTGSYSSTAPLVKLTLMKGE